MKNLRDAIANLQNRRDAAKAEGGFSFIELVIVVAVIGILTAIAIPAYGSIQNTARINSIDAAAQQSYSSVLANLAQGDTFAEATGKATAAYAPAGAGIDIAVTGTNEDTLLVTATWGAPDVTNHTAQRGAVPTAN